MPFERESSPSEAPPPPTAPADPELDLAIVSAALRYADSPALTLVGLAPADWHALFRANVVIESALDPEALGPAGAIGLGQLMPATARDLGVDPYDAIENLDGSARYLLALLDRFGDPRLAVAAYNAGPEAVERHGGIPPYPETETHVARVMTLAARLSETLR